MGRLHELCGVQVLQVGQRSLGRRHEALSADSEADE
jgi:hypothetical protein